MDAAQFESHALWTKPEQVSGAMAAMEPVPETVGESFGQIRFLASQLSGFKSVDPRLFTLAQLDAANGQWQEVLSYLGHHQGNPTGTYYSNAQSFAEAWLQSAGAWHRPNGSTRLAQQAKLEYETLINSYKEANDSLHKTLKVTMTELDAHRNAWASDVGALRQEVAASLREATDSMDGLSREREQLRSTLTSTTSEFNTFQSQRSKDFDLAQSARKKEFEDWLDGQEADFAQLAGPKVKQIDGLVDSATASHDAIDALRESTETLAGVTSGEILSKKYGTQARFEWWFGVGAYVLGFASLAAGAWMIWETVGHLAQDSEISWQFVALKFGISAAIVGAATMAFRLGFRFMQNSNANKRIELELNAIGPFLADLSIPTDIDKAKLQFVEKTFGRTWDGHTADADGQPQSVDLVKAITDMVVSIAKK